MRDKIQKIFLEKHSKHINTLGPSEIEGYKRAVSMSLISSELRAKLYEKVDEREKEVGRLDTNSALAVESELKAGE